MIYSYGITQQGTLHLRQNIVCQDAHRIVKINDTLVIAAVADGLGSEQHSDIAARLAVDLSVGYCATMITAETPDEQLPAVIQEAFSRSQDKIEQTAYDNGDDLDQYDTTLTLAVLRGTTLFYGHSGDSGMVALSINGQYEKVTEQQRDAEGRVFPLFFRLQKWEFGQYPIPVVSVFLATDGMLESLFPLLLRSEATPIYIKLARYFMDAEALHLQELGVEEVQKRRAGYLSSIPDSAVNDDKTVVVLVNTDVKPLKQPPEYYQEPDWTALRQKHNEEWKKLAYPSLYGEKTTVQEPQTVSTEKIPQEATPQNPESAPLRQSEAVSSTLPPSEKAAPTEKRRGKLESFRTTFNRVLDYLDTKGSPDFYQEERKNQKK